MRALCHPTRRDPSKHGWTQTGAHPQSGVKHFQKDDVKMDFYPNTGTVKTSMDHPEQGKTQMWRKGLSDADFKRVCENPRAHTGQGYQRKHK